MPADTPWSDVVVDVPVLPSMTRPCAGPDLRDGLATPWSARWSPAVVPAPREPVDRAPEQVMSVSS